MKKTIAALLLLCLGVALLSFPASAANHVGRMEIDVALRPDGSAAVTQVWTADTDEGTEFYLACRDSGYLHITDFSVSDDAGAYAFSEDWDVDASFEEKAGKCGIVETEDGVELCWGISRYGSRRYTLTYVLHGLVGAYTDADGFNHRFVDATNLFPTDVALTLRCQDGTPLTEASCAAWGFGFDGQVQFEDGAVYAWSETALDGDEHMTVMLSMPKGMLTPLRQEEGSFEAVKERAFDGSDYEDDDVNILLVIAALVLLGLLFVLGSVVAAQIRKARLRRRMERVEYFREAPNHGDLNITHRLGTACELCREDALLGAYLLRLISDGALEPLETGARSSAVDLRLNRPPRNGTPHDDTFYTILEAAAGPDGILQARELERFCDQNAAPLATFVDSCQRNADMALIRAGCYRGAVCESIKGLTAQGLQQLDEILGLKRFLLDFSLIHERGVQETVLWQDYLIYAQLLGIADQVAPQIRRLYPEVLPQVERFERCISYAGYYNGYMYGAYTREMQRQQAARSAGHGGSSSLGGGGGFSGGGGAGTR